MHIAGQRLPRWAEEVQEYSQQEDIEQYVEAMETLTVAADALASPQQREQLPDGQQYRKITLDSGSNHNVTQCCGRGDLSPDRDN